MEVEQSTLFALVAAVAGPARASRLFAVLVVPDAVAAEQGSRASRAVLAQALNMLLFEDLLARVPAASDYVEDCLREGRTVMHDHGAVRTVALDRMGTLPRGEEAILRLLRPLGYVPNGVYPLDRLKMVGRSYAQAEFKEEIAQFFISELYPERFSPEFQEAVARVTASSIDPLTPEARGWLSQLEADGALEFTSAAALLPVLVGCFGRQHEAPLLADYQRLLVESAEMAWISTEGNAFNHATDRVPDVELLTEQQKRLGRPMKPTVERSATGRVQQTAYLAARVERDFRMEDGSRTTLEVPGSFLEFITRLPLPDEDRLDLSFDSANAQAIFKMTAGK